MPNSSMPNLSPDPSDTVGKTAIPQDAQSKGAELTDPESVNTQPPNLEAKTVEDTKLGDANVDSGLHTLQVEDDKEDKSPSPAYAKLPRHLTKRPKLVPNRGHALIWYLLSILVIGLDQWTKWLANTRLNFHDPVPVIEPILNWTLAYNYGAAFSFLADQSGWQKWFFAGISILMSVFLIIFLTRTPRQAKLLNVGLALILGGAIGNLIDRLRIGKVIDFIHVHYADVWHYPIFNIADIAICVGVALVIFDMLFIESKRNDKYQS